MVRLTAAVIAALALTHAEQADALKAETFPRNPLQTAQCAGNGACCMTNKCCASRTHVCKAKVDSSYAECVERPKCPGKGWKCDRTGMREDGSDASSDSSRDSRGSRISWRSWRRRWNKRAGKCDKTYWPKPNLDGCFWENTEVRASTYYGEHDAATHKDCQKLCQSVTGCETWVWGDWKKCYLKGCLPNRNEGFKKVVFLDQTKNVQNGGGKFISGPKECNRKRRVVEVVKDVFKKKRHHHHHHGKKSYHRVLRGKH